MAEQHPMLERAQTSLEWFYRKKARLNELNTIDRELDRGEEKEYDLLMIEQSRVIKEFCAAMNSYYRSENRPETANPIMENVRRLSDNKKITLATGYNV